MISDILDIGSLYAKELCNQWIQINKHTLYIDQN